MGRDFQQRGGGGGFRGGDRGGFGGRGRGGGGGGFGGGFRRNQEPLGPPQNLIGKELVKEWKGRSLHYNFGRDLFYLTMRNGIKDFLRFKLCFSLNPIFFFCNENNNHYFFLSEVAEYSHPCKEQMLCTSNQRRYVPKFNKRVFLQNKAQVGTIDEILGPVDNYVRKR